MRREISNTESTHCIINSSITLANPTQNILKTMRSLISSFQITGLLCLLLFFGCDSAAQEETGPEPQRPLSQAEQQVVETDNVFGLNLYSKLSTAAPDENLFISPLSVSMALGMTLNGAEGDTRTGMLETLEKQGLSEESINTSYQSLMDRFTRLDPKVKLDIANSIWYREGFTVEPAFLDVNQSYFDAEIAALDFDAPSAPDAINNWVDDNTNGLIDKIVDQINPDDVMYLINAIYFKGAWTYEFDESGTTDQPFYNIDDTESSVPLMNLVGSVAYTQTEDARIIDLPYGDSLFSMTLILPNDPASFDSFSADISSEIWNSWTDNLRAQNVTVYLPRFKLEYEKPLKNVLTTMGMTDAFSPQKADFSGINGSRQLFISNVLHKSFVEVNEEGTEAAAVTSVVVSVTSAGGDQPVVFRADRPFIFAIREHHSGSILFIGKVVNL